MHKILNAGGNKAIMTVNPFTIQVDNAVLTDLKQRLARTRWPDEISASDWDYGTNLAYLQELVTYWHDTFDWRAQEQLLNSFPQFKADIDGQGIHFIHVKGKGTNPLPLIISHGWPGSFFEMYKIIGPLTDPVSFGGRPEDAFDVVVPSLPGYGFSDRPRERGMDVGRIAELFQRLMTEQLNYPRFGAQGGDWGSAITTRLGQAYPATIIGIHLNMLIALPRSKSAEPDPEELRWREQVQHFQQAESAYGQIQGTKPQTLAYGLNDSPAGLAGWIVEKFRTWSDCQGDVESVYTKDELLTNIMIYWVTETINSSTRLYYETMHNSQFSHERVTVPTGVALFPKDISLPPRTLAEQYYNIQRWTNLEKGGHFAALEQPESLINELRTFFQPLRA
jgi:pimeloyl-ACP methyl ester carboxylesterase